jgi:hypothetical protein
MRPSVTALEGRALLAQITVNSLLDDGSAGTLRWAVGQANASKEADTIVFSPSTFDAPRTITLTGGALSLTGSYATTITGPGANLLTVRGGGQGGVFIVDGATAAISGLTVTGGTAAVGGGVRNDGGTLTLSNVAVLGNAATGQGGGGVANRFGGTTNVVASLVSGNTSTSGGAGLLNQGGTLSLTNVTITANTATTGGGVASSDGTTTLLNTTVTANTAGSGGGLSVASGSTSLTNTIVAKNTGGDVSGTTTGGDNVIGVDPKLSPLGDYGGPTLTMTPLPGSPAINAGTATGAPATDQRGQPRVGRIDVGAFESQVTIPVNTVLDGVGSAPGQIGLRQAVNLANALTSEDAIVFTGLFTTPQTITLTAGPLVLTDKATTTVAGPGANLLTVSGGGKGRVFDIAGGSVAMQDLTITAGSADNGGGLRNDGGKLVMTDAVVTGNLATGTGGGLQNAAGSATLNNVTFSNNSASDGGGLANAATLSMTGCTVTGNTAGFTGGGLSSRFGTLTLTNTTVSGNTANSQGDRQADGGGLYSLASTLDLSGCTFSGNQATGPGASGGGLFTRSDYGDPLNVMTMTNCTLTGNSCPDYGGALYMTQYSSATLTNVTIVGNSAGFPGGAGGIRFSSENTMTLTNGIVALNTGGDIQAPAGEPVGSNNIIGVDPMLAPLGDYGGPTPTMPPLPGSPAVGAGTHNNAPTTDQRGFVRGASIDIGAFQGEGTTLVVNATVDGVGSGPGQISLRQAINLANVELTAHTISFDPTVFQTPQTITLSGTQLELANTTASMTITGPAAGVTVSGDGTSRVFKVDAGVTASISGLTITGGKADVGGGVRNDGTLALTECTISGNCAQGRNKQGGGGVYDDGTLALTGCTITRNYAYGIGGGLANHGTATLLGCTITNNSSAGGGGGLSQFNPGNPSPGSMSLTNCTVSGNSTTGNGGGLYNLVYQHALTLTNCTVTGNSALYGGGLYSFSNPTPMVLTNTIVAGNVASRNSNDVQGNASGSNNLIGGNPLLAPLGNYGGSTQTCPLLPGSPAIGGGTATGAPATDQRGVARPAGTHPDIGAFQSRGFTVATAQGSNPQSTPINHAFPNPLTVIVTANNSIEPVDGGVVSFAVTPVGGASAALSATTATIAGGQASVMATANGTTGTYLVTASASGAGELGFALNNTEKSSLRVTTTADVVDATDGLTSLREAIAYANRHPGPDTIVFATAAFGSRARTIALRGGPLVLTDKATTTIVGPGAGRLTIDGAGRSRVLDVRGGSLAVSRLTIAGGRADYGGGVRNDGGRLALTDVVLRGNSARVLGGGLFNDGTAMLRDVTVVGNAAAVGGGIANTGKWTRAAVVIRRNSARFARDLFDSRPASLVRRR